MQISRQWSIWDLEFGVTHVHCQIPNTAMVQERLHSHTCVPLVLCWALKLSLNRVRLQFGVRKRTAISYEFVSKTGRSILTNVICFMAWCIHLTIMTFILEMIARLLWIETFISFIDCICWFVIRESDNAIRPHKGYWQTSCDWDSNHVIELCRVITTTRRLLVASWPESWFRVIQNSANGSEWMSEALVSSLWTRDVVIMAQWIPA